jgi:phage terminase small subunit
MVGKDGDGGDGAKEVIMTMTATAPPPAHLSERAAAFWAVMVATYDVGDPPALELLRLCCENLDIGDTARTTLAAEGQTIVDRYGQCKPHPCAGIERGATIAVARLLRELRVLEPPEAPRPTRLA